MNAKIMITRLLLSALIIIPASVFAKGGKKDNTITDTRTVSKSFDVNADAQFNLTSREADVNITTWSQNKVEVKVTLTVEAFEQEELDKMLNEMNINIEGSPENVTVKSAMKIKSQITTGSKTKIKTEDQTIKIKNFKFVYDIKLPSTNHLNVKNSYGDILLSEHSGRLEISLYEGKLTADKITSNEGKLSLRYSSATLGSVKSLSIESYESDITLASANQLELNAKYSKVTTKGVKDVKLSAYESTINLGVSNHISGKHNYGSLIIAEAKKVDIKTYELKFEAGNIDQLKLTESKYSKITCAKVGMLQLENAYENKMLISDVGSVSGNAKYCRLDIGSLKKSLNLEGYEFTCRLMDVSNNFTEISFSGKYSKLEIQLPANAGFKLNADLTYGDVRFPTSKFVASKNTDADNHRVLQGTIRDYGGTSTINIKGYETDASLIYK